MAKEKDEKTEIAQPEPKGTENSSPAEAKAKPAGSKRLVVIAAAVVLLGGGGAAAWYFLRSHGDSSVADITPTTDSIVQADSVKASLASERQAETEIADSLASDPTTGLSDAEMASLMDEFNYDLDTNAILEEIGLADSAKTDSTPNNIADAQTTTHPVPSPEDTLMAIDAPTSGVIPQHIMKLQAALAEREAQLKKREQDLDQREKELADRELRMQQHVSQKVVAMAKLYDGMEPAAAAKVLVNLEDDVVADLIPRMKPKNAAAVMALLPPVRAAEISRQIMAITEE